jgi:hypothetical protein
VRQIVQVSAYQVITAYSEVPRPTTLDACADHFLDVSADGALGTLKRQVSARFGGRQTGILIVGQIRCNSPLLKSLICARTCVDSINLSLRTCRGWCQYGMELR